MKTWIVAAIVGTSLLASTLAAEAQMLYRYTDAQGRVQMTDDPNMIPQGKGGVVDAQPMPKATARPVPVAPAPPASGLGDPETRGRDQALNALWAQKKSAEAYAKTLLECRGAAWQEDSRWEMYEPSPGRYKMVGSARANFAFERCMEQRGIPFKSSSR